MAHRLPLVVANWKLNGDRELLENMTSELATLDKTQVETVVCPPFVYLAEDTQGVKKGAQDVASQESGAFTGEVAGKMLRDVGCQYVIVGHSERRALFGETDEVVANKVLATLNAGLVPIICVGETDEEREAGATIEVITRQVKAVLDVLPSYADSLVLAYEPVWAIGTGKTASCEQAEEVHAKIRQILLGYNQEMAETTRILYGGSVKPENSEELFASENIDGGLIGGASLVVDSFMAICENAKAQERSMLYEVLIVVYLLVAMALVGLILIQQGKGSDMGASFGAGASATLFGSSGAGNFLTRTTTVLATLFFVISIFLGSMTANSVKQEGEWSDLAEDAPVAEQVLPVDGDVPAANDSDVPASDKKDGDVPVN